MSKSHILLVSPAQLAFPPASEMMALSKVEHEGKESVSIWGPCHTKMCVSLKTRLRSGEVRCLCYQRHVGTKIVQGNMKQHLMSPQGYMLSGYSGEHNCHLSSVSFCQMYMVS